jgi:2-keto-4-pentenoate hydratase/2-oxohepta-3-ene-1,7-dioic acid hydratase in catechol pathway
MRIAQASVNNIPAVVASVDENSGWVRLAGYADLSAVLMMDKADLAKVVTRGVKVAEDAITFHAPVIASTKIIAVGLNYKDHIRETGATAPAYPLLFAKLTSSVIDPGAAIEWDTTLTNAVDYEAELAVVIGRTARHVSAENALDYVFGYTCVNDVSARDLQTGDGQWTRAKGLDTFCPLGPWLVTSDAIPDPQALAIYCTVNGEMRQNSSTAEMVFGVREIVAHITKAFTLNPGDIILTGTPNGVGNARTPKALLKNGDVVVVELEHIGKLENSCRTLN